MLQVENIDLYYGASQALKSVAIRAEIGRVSCVLGRNGVGKTSLLRAIAGHQPIRAGRVLWEEEDISGFAPYDRAARGIAYVPQGREIFPLLTVLENLQTGYAALPRALRHVPDEIFDLFPVLKEMLTRRGGDLSGGQQQQLAIARALANRPSILLADEPTGNLDPGTADEVFQLLMSQARGAGLAALIATHNPDLAARMDRTVTLDDGHLV